MRSNVQCMLTRLLLAFLLSFILVWPVGAQGPIYLPIIEASMIKPLRSTIAITLPEEDTNYVLNPSAEIDDNFTATGAATVNRVTTFQKYGLYSYEVVTTGGGDAIEFDLLTLPNTDVYITFRMRGAGSTQFEINLGGEQRVVNFLEKIDANWGLYGAFFPSSVASGQTVMDIEQTNVGANTFYIDGVQVSQLIDGRHYTTYIDGTQEGCRWLGAPHASASTRSGDSRAGGVVTSFWEGFNFFPEKALGLGTTIEELNIDSYAFLPGGELNSSKIPPREFTIIGYFLADSVEELHEHAQRLELELGLNTYPGRQPVRLRYSGARVLKEISANYTGGLEGDLPIFYNDDWSQEDEAWVRNYKFKMRASISWVALDPFWYEVGESATLLDTLDTLTYRNVAGRIGGQWSNLGPPDPAGTYSGVFSIAEDATYVYFGGQFSNFDNIAAADTIVRYNKQTGAYSALGVIPEVGAIQSMALTADGKLFVAVDNSPTDWHALYWDTVTETWTDLGEFNEAPLSVTVSPTGLVVYGGGFTDIDGTSVDFVASYNLATATWAAVGSGLDDIVRALVYSQDTLYAAGEFTDFFQYFDGSNWNTVGNGLDNPAYSLAVPTPNDGRVFVGGTFTGNLSYYNGSIIQSLGIGINTNIRSLSWATNDYLYLSAASYFKWNGYTLTLLDFQPPGIIGPGPIFASKYVDPVVSTIYPIYTGFLDDGDGISSGLATSENQGTISAFPLIVFSRSGGDSATIQTLRNERTGRELLFNYSLLDGESLTINLNPKNRTITSSFFGPRMDAILANSDFSTWQLLPGENDVTSFVSESGSPTITAYLLFREPYRGWN